ncbi:hypothetical protein AGLY_017375 [Aphis glycines]|uniref:Uncharacterized protein n=1 Tax=Aphis glycines TaxID=307491 RepID=A0A6G0SV22_APHGL|nr:hypothetical protein AGLY_017375 [Aphis glycines]
MVYCRPLPSPRHLLPLPSKILQKNPFLASYLCDFQELLKLVQYVHGITFELITVNYYSQILGNDLSYGNHSIKFNVCNKLTIYYGKSLTLFEGKKSRSSGYRSASNLETETNINPNVAAMQLYLIKIKLCGVAEIAMLESKAKLNNLQFNQSYVDDLITFSLIGMYRSPNDDIENFIQDKYQLN